ncbi:MAG: excinuclease ABC subunit C [Gammaproteobacteria bacterium RIFCSPHIGHO2_12_FULL_38_11]|nr:MAG: excinuclease ABC subunit C [Gammaproteobacteria bacterium RIFCSPHIGHO2_12_FULL_38_11]
MNIQHIPSSPGVYRFLDAQKKILYVGKAKNLKKRVSQYFQKNITNKKTAALMAKAVDVEITITDSENQALLLEANLIKQHRPRYNVLLRDDKAYPYLFLSKSMEAKTLANAFPRLDYHRGPKKEKGRYFGPYPNAGSVRDNLALIQKLFKLRQCSDIFFSHRSRPCLQYQINRCTAPCVNLVSKENYQIQVQDAIDFLEGKNKTIMHSVEKRMHDHSKKLDYEKAANCRDLLIRLRQLQTQQFITGGKNNVDIFGVVENRGDIAIAVVAIRHGQMMGHKTFFPHFPVDTIIDEVLCEFIPQYYFNPERQGQSIDRIVVSHSIADRLWIQNALQEILKSKVKISDRKTAAFREWQSIAVANATDALKSYQIEKNNMVMKCESLQKALNLRQIPERIECFDISHTQGSETKASCVFFGEQGAIKKLYRQFNIDNITPGDDYAAMEQVLTRRYMSLKKNNITLPDLIIVDGGKGQLKIAASVLEALQISGIVLMGVAKGPTRKSGVEKIWLWGKAEEIALAENNPARHFIQQIRDEAHRFAITAHRKSLRKRL